MLDFFLIVLQVPEALFTFFLVYFLSFSRLGNFCCSVFQLTDSLLCPLLFCHPSILFGLLYFSVLQFPFDSSLYLLFLYKQFVFFHLSIFLIVHWGILMMKMKVAQLCQILCNPMDCSPPGSSVRGILQARILEWVAIPFSRGSSQTRIKPRSLALQEDSLLSELIGLFIKPLSDGF